VRGEPLAESRWKGGETEMWRKKRLVLVLMLAVVVLLGTVGGIVLAQDDGGNETQVEDRCGVLLDKITAIYEENTGVAIDQEQLKEAFAQACNEMLADAMQTHLQNLVDDGVITQEEADQYLEWWQARPDVQLGGPGLRGFGGGGFHGIMHGGCGMWGR
jgi:hypothetical protein